MARGAAQGIQHSNDAELLSGCYLSRLQLKALLRRQWIFKSRSWGSTLAELLSPVVLVSMLVLAFSLVHPEHRDARLYAGDTAELLHNMTRDLVKTQQVSDLALCGAYLSSGGGVNGGSGGGNGGNGVRRLLQEGAEQEGPQKTVMPWPGPAVPGEVDCGMRKPGVRCSRDPCQDASCPGEPAAACVPFYCQEPRWFRGVHVTQQPCSAVFVDRSFGDVVDCSTAAKPLPAHRNPSGDPPEVSGSSKNGGSGSNSASVSGGDRLPVKLPIKSSRTMGSISGNRTAPSLQTYAMDLLIKMATEALKASASPEKQAAFTDCVRDALAGPSSGAGGGVAVALQGLQGFISGNGPLPIPTFDEFLGLSKMLQAALGASPGAVNALHGARRHFGWNLLGNLLDTGKIAFAPATPEVLRFVDHMAKTTEYFSEYFHGVFRTEAEAESFALESTERLWALVTFKDGPHQYSGLTDYTIRLNFTTTPPTWIPVNKWKRHLSVYPKQYISSGFLSIQSAVDGYVMGSTPGADTTLDGPPADDGPTVNGSGGPWTEWSEPFPTPSYIHNRFYDAVGPMLGLIMALSLVLPLSMLIRGIVEEKESGARDLLYIHGLQPWVLHCAWVLTYLAVFTIVSGAVTGVCIASFLQRTQPSVLLALLLGFSLSELAFGVLVASVFSRAKIAAIVGPLLHFCLLLPRFIFFRAGEPQALGSKWAASLAAPTAFTFAADLIAQYEGSGNGLTWGASFDDSFPLAAILGLLILDAKLYLLLAWYVEKVLPGGYGPRLHWSFAFRPSYWLARMLPAQQWLHERAPRVFASGTAGYTPILTDAGAPPGQAQVRTDGHEDGSDQEAAEAAARPPPVVSIRGLTKSYGYTQALRGVDLDMHAGTITALLGHNGAGKSTLIGILTGMVQPTGGDALLAGHSVVHQPGAAQHACVGLCPQHDVQFPGLTVREHLELMAAVRGIPGGRTTAEAAADEVGLAKKLSSPAAALSGGMKRKLQMALALMGRPAVVVVDEGSSGMDAVARQQLQDLLRGAAEWCALLYSTHFMDEADALADDIAVLASGRLVCHGSSLTLKERYGDGHTLTVARSVGHVAHAAHVSGGGAGDLEALVAGAVAGATVVRSAGGEVAFRLPSEGSAAFPDLLDALEQQGESLGVGHYGLSSPSLEEVFLRVTTEEHASSPQAVPPQHTSHPDSTDSPHDHTNSSTSTPFASHSNGQSRRDEPSRDGTSHASGSAVGGTASPATAAGQAPRPLRSLSSASASASASELHGDGDHTSAFETVDLDDRPMYKQQLPAEQQHVHQPPLTAGLSGHSPRSSTASAVRADGTGPPSYGTKAGAYQPPAGWHRHVRHFREMVRKRALVASRDVKGAFFTLLLPVLAVAAVLSILKVNIDPTAPRMELTLGTFGQKDAIPIAGRPAGWAELCLQSVEDAAKGLRGYGVEGGCGNAQLMFVDRDSVQGSYQMSQQLLQGLDAGARPQYAALVFGDNVTSHVQGRVRDAAEAAFPAAAHLNVTSAVERLGGSLAGLLALSQGTPAGRVARNFVQRMKAPAVTVMHNGSSYHALPALLSDLHEAQAVLQSDSSTTGPSLRVWSHPLPLTNAESLQLDTVLAVLAAIFILVPLCYLSGAYAITPVQERASGAAHLQRAAGCGAAAYWGGHAAWDAATHGLLSLLTLAIFAAYGDGATTGNADKALGTLALLVGYGLAIIPAAYCLSFSFDSPSAAQVCIAAVNFVAGFLLVVGSRIMAQIPETQAAQAWLVHFFRLVPPFNLGEGLIQLSVFSLEQGLSEAAAAAPLPGDAAAAAVVQAAQQPSVFGWGVLGRPLTYLAVEAVVLFAAVLALEAAAGDGDPWALLGNRIFSALRRPFWRRRREFVNFQGHPMGPAADVEMGSLGPLQQQTDSNAYEVNGKGDGSSSGDPQQEDTDVARERAHVMQGGGEGDVISLRGLHKHYAGMHDPALMDLCLGIRVGERFGFLGANGAGKTTALSIVAARRRPTSGAAFVAGHPAGSPPAAAALGFCPQTDPLLGLLTALEHLRLFCRLKGVPEQEVEGQVQGLLQRVALPPAMARRSAQTYSGGNKRKLSLAIALAGMPQAVLLDEPSSGMDPGARRAMWGAILSATEASGVAVVLTTHSMEEVEVLCSRVGIMAGGCLACLGTPQQLKSRHGGSYLLEVVVSDAATHSALAAWAARHLGATPTTAPTGTRAVFRLPSSAVAAETCAGGCGAAGFTLREADHTETVGSGSGSGSGSPAVATPPGTPGSPVASGELTPEPCDIAEEDMMCPVCMEPMYMPLGLACGHKACLECALEAAGLQKMKGTLRAVLLNAPRHAQCFQCRQPGMFNKAVLLKQLGAAIERKFPEDIAEAQKRTGGKTSRNI
mmetsp:Transcript_7891/g.23248  ORF Transcript_7891/g.23248 Transcript_7891/m.23248 type:complete len:2373 (+) Transcript_7891:472-7590(+)